jgi:DNA-binding NarL/FixJ family response regulator
MEKIKVILSHPQVIFREGIHFILSGEEDFEVAGETTGNQAAFDIIEGSQARVVILSDADKKSDSAEITRRIRQSFPTVSVILITEKMETGAIFPAIAGGASAILTADTDPDFMVAVIHDVAQGKLPVVEALLLPPVAARALADFQDLAMLQERLGIAMALLSKKESEVLAEIAGGSELAKIASKLNLSGDAIKGHLRAVVQKLVANDRTRALLEKTQMTLPSLLHIMSKRAGLAEYLTRAEFEEFKESLTKAFKSAFGGKPETRT